MRNFFNSHSEIVSAQNLKPLAEGIVLLHPFIGLTNDIITLSADNDIYGNQASSLDKGIATVDMLSFGTSKVITAISTTTKLGTAATTIGKIASGINIATMLYSSYNTIKNGYEK